MSDSYEELTRYYAEIVNGYSDFELPASKETYYIKHLSQQDLADVISYTNQLIKGAVSKGIDKEEDQIKFIVSQGWWSEEQEMHINANRNMISQLEKTRHKLNYFSEKEQLNKQIKDHEKQLQELLIRRSEYLGMTAEGWANSKATEYCIARLLYKNKDITERCFDIPEQFYDLEDNIIVEYKLIYYEYLSGLTDSIVKQVAATGFMQNLLFVAGDSVMSFYGKPVINLSKHQTDLVLYGKAYRRAIRKKGWR